jgi:hypothetical protein
LVDRDGTEGFAPAISVTEMYAVLQTALAKRVGHTLSAIQDGNDVVFAWFGLLDTVGHMAPATDTPLQETYYQVAANTTKLIHEIVPDEAQILSLSDHGLQNGSHTHYATLCSDNADAIAEINSILDVSGWIEDANPGFNPDKQASIDGERMEEVNEQLENLGYV